ncbi:MAG: YidC/Oxa1 family insertase periplasmic-domain containing protein, partial [Acidobacteriota bacterium]
TNRGAAISSYRLLGYEGDEGQPLELVQDASFPGRTLPLQLLGDDGPDQELYSVEETGGALVYLWSDGRGNSVRKTIRLSGEGYGLDIEIVTTGERRNDLLSVGTGMRNPGEIERNSRLALWGEGVLLADGEVERLKRKKVKNVIVETPATLQFIGFEDAYFFNLLRPEGGVSEIQIEPFEYSLGDGEEDTNRILRISVAPCPRSLLVSPRPPPRRPVRPAGRAATPRGCAHPLLPEELASRRVFPSPAGAPVAVGEERAPTSRGESRPTGRMPGGVFFPCSIRSILLRQRIMGLPPASRPVQYHAPNNAKIPLAALPTAPWHSSFGH